MASVSGHVIDLAHDEDDEAPQTLRDRILQLAVPAAWTREAEDPPGALLPAFRHHPRLQYGK